MRTLLVTLALLSAATGSSRGDPNIYGPHGENLGPNPELDLVFPDLRQKKAGEEELREQNRLLQQQVQNLEQQQKQLQQQEQMQGSRQYQNPIQIQINSGYGYPSRPYENFGWWPYGNFGWGGGGAISITSGGRHHQHMNKGGHGGKGGQRRR